MQSPDTVKRDSLDTFKFTVELIPGKPPAVRIEFEPGSIAEGLFILTESESRLAEMYATACRLAGGVSHDALNAAQGTAATAESGAAPATTTRGPGRPKGSTKKQPDPSTAQAPAPIDPPAAAAPPAPPALPPAAAAIPQPPAPPPLPAAPPVQPATADGVATVTGNLTASHTNALGVKPGDDPLAIPPGLQRTVEAPAAAAPPPPPPPPPAPPAATNRLAELVIADLKRRAAGTADNGQQLADWLASYQLVGKGANLDQAITVIQFFDDAKMQPVAKALELVQ